MTQTKELFALSILRVLAILGCLIVVDKNIDAAPQEVLQTAISQYTSGDVIAATKTLGDHLESLRLPITDKADRNDALFLLTICESVYDFACVTKYLEYLEQPEDVPSTRETAVEYLYHYLHTALFAQDRSSFMDVVGKLSEIKDLATLRPDLLPEIKALLAHIYLLENKPGKARKLLNESLAFILNNYAVHPYITAVRLRQILGLLTASGESQRAYQLAAIAEPFLNDALRGNVVQQFHLAELKANIAYLIRNIDLTLDYYREANNILDGMSMPVDTLTVYQGEISTNIAFLCALKNEEACTRDALQNHPYKNIVAKAVEGQLALHPSIFAFIAVSTISKLAFGHWLPEDFIKALDLPLMEGTGPLGDSLAVSYKEFARATLKFGESEELARPHFFKAARARIDLFQYQLSDNPDGFPLVSLVDQFALSVALRRFKSEGPKDMDEADLALSIMEVLNRNLRYAETEALSALATAKVGTESRLVHSNLRLESKRKLEERRLLRNLIDHFNGEENQSKLRGDVSFNVSKYSQLAQYSKEKSKIAAAYPISLQAHRGRWDMPTIGQLQKAMTDNEAVLITTVGESWIAALCVKKTGFEFSVTDSDFTSADHDFRIVLASLSATHPANTILDKQFPAEAAVRLYDLLIRPSNSCLSAINHLIWIANGELLKLPLAALLEEIPPRDGEGYRLSGAKWLVNRFSFSYVSSVRGFLAARRLGKSADTALRTLAVGNPSLRPARSTEAIDGEGKPGSQFSFLPELPNTARELALVSRAGGSLVDVLSSREASEAQVRHRVLGQYEVILFATHGVIRDEIEGLDQAALVLTPGDLRISADDGLLTASEIADLRLNARMVVLSACNSANFDVDIFGSEVQGLATAFAIAGVPATIASLWPVESTVSAELIGNLFKSVYSMEKITPAQALFAAVRAFLSKKDRGPWNHPRFWAPYIVFGDGGQTLSHKQLDAPDEDRLIQSIVFASDGEIIQLVKSVNNQIYIRGFADPIQDRFQSIVGRLTQDGRMDWLYRHQVFGANRMAISADGSLLLGNYMAKEDESIGSVLVLLDNQNSEIWQKDLSRKGYDSMVLDVISEKQERTFLAIVGYQNKGKWDEGYTTGRILRIGLDAQIHNDRNFSFGEFGVSEYVRMSSNGRKLVLVGAAIVFGIADERIDDYGLKVWCWRQDQSVLIEFSPSTLEQIGVQTVEDSALREIFIDDDSELYVAGERKVFCEQNKQAFFGKLKKDGTLEVLHEEPRTFDSQYKKIIAHEDKFILLGQSTRTFDIQEMKTGERELGNLGYEEMDRRLDQRVELEIIDGFFVELSRQFDETRRIWIQTGADVYLSDGLVVNDHLLFGGAVGRKLMWGKASLGQRE